MSRTGVCGRSPRWGPRRTLHRTSYRRRVRRRSGQGRAQPRASTGRPRSSRAAARSHRSHRSGRCRRPPMLPEGATPVRNCRPTADPGTGRRLQRRTSGNARRTPLDRKIGPGGGTVARSRHGDARRGRADGGSRCPGTRERGGGSRRPAEQCRCPGSATEAAEPTDVPQLPLSPPPKPDDDDDDGCGTDSSTRTATARTASSPADPVAVPRAWPVPWSARSAAWPGQRRASPVGLRPRAATGELMRCTGSAPVSSPDSTGEATGRKARGVRPGGRSHRGGEQALDQSAGRAVEDGVRQRAGEGSAGRQPAAEPGVGDERRPVRGPSIGGSAQQAGAAPALRLPAPHRPPWTYRLPRHPYGLPKPKLERPRLRKRTRRRNRCPDPGLGPPAPAAAQPIK